MRKKIKAEEEAVQSYGMNTCDIPAPDLFHK